MSRPKSYRKPKNCETCGKVYTRVCSAKRWEKSKYCSHVCRSKSPENKEHSGIFKKGLGHPFFGKRGKEHHSWKGGVNDINNTIRNSKESKLWRVAVFERDDYTCRFCGVRGGTLNADHIKPFAYFPELRFAIDNGRTLCVPCHRSTNTWGNKKQPK